MPQKHKLQRPTSRSINIAGYCSFGEVERAFPPKIKRCYLTKNASGVRLRGPSGAG